ncbi:MAG: hypothetical protein HONBIEJF_00225 [Fimbriimonadaceae bacterium]|nr:hypothetical protein [Fimbriimonadaceae bacterium]
MTALRNLSVTEGMMAGTTQRLSSGLRINTAADDPAGLVISESMRAQLKGIDQAIRNSQDAINMSKTAEAALDEVQTLLKNIRALAVHSANSAVIDATQLQANQTQIRSTLQSIDRIGSTTSWGTKKLLDGTAGAMANVTRPSDVSSIYVGGTFNGVSVANGPITMTKTTQATRAAVTLGNTFANGNAIVTAVGSFVINGYSFTSDGTETLNSIVGKVNEMSNITGVTATLVAVGANVSVRLDSNEYGSQHGFNFFDPSNIIHNAASATGTGVDGVFSVQLTTTAGVTTATFTGGMGPKESGLRLRDSYGNTVLLTENGNAGLAAATQVGVMTAGNVRFQIGPNGNQSTQFSMPVIFANRLGSGAVAGKTLADLDVTTQQGAQDAMKIIDAAVTELAQRRGELGSFQANFLESTSRSLAVAEENLTASESQIRDADMAEEITAFTRLQILRESGMSILAQANQQPQGILNLLRG